MRFASLGSGSEGNGLVVEVGGSRLMIDCGFGVRDAAKRLGRLGLAPGDLHAIVVTHEHSDHVGGVAAFAAKHAVPVWLTFGTLACVGERFAGIDRVFGFDSHESFSVGSIEVRPFPVPHDAREPVQFVLGDGAVRLGVVTDLGTSTPAVERALTGLDALVLECNHDAAMLAEGPYPANLKARIAGRFGHLANDASAALLAALDNSRLKHIVAAHLSKQNNTSALARAALAGALGCTEGWIGIADQDDGFDWREV
ncbi:MAG: MBL fold metallo-hydrolase [Burkholderiales bacterium]|nr:MBL fold metallo-hydrolase [Burkholderiales bacterium]MCE7876358.1 MBL fold metallo-hydrolase [Betaproteobacteria bacterium PRO3]